MTRIFSLQGGADRFEWWWLSLSSDVIAQVCLIAVALRMVDQPQANAGPAVLLCLIAAGCIWIAISVTCRRLRTRRRSPWWALMYLVPYLGFLWLMVDCGILPDPGQPRKRKVVRRVVQAPR